MFFRSCQQWQMNEVSTLSQPTLTVAWPWIMLSPWWPVEAKKTWYHLVSVSVTKAKVHATFIAGLKVRFYPFLVILSLVIDDMPRFPTYHQKPQKPSDLTSHHPACNICRAHLQLLVATAPKVTLSGCRSSRRKALPDRQTTTFCISQVLHSKNTGNPHRSSGLFTPTWLKWSWSSCEPWALLYGHAPWDAFQAQDLDKDPMVLGEN